MSSFVEHLGSDSPQDLYSRTWVEAPGYPTINFSLDDYPFEGGCSDPFSLKAPDEELDAACRDIFDEWESRQALERRCARRKSWRASEPRPLADSKRPSTSKQKKRRVPRSKVPHKDAFYLSSLRNKLRNVYDGRLVDGWNWSAQYPNLERALLHLLFVDGHYATVKHAIEMIWDRENRNPPNWPLSYYPEVQAIWDESLYHVVVSHKRREDLTPVNTFRIRCKFPSPLQRLVGKSRYNISENAAHILKAFYECSVSGKPTRAEKQELSKDTGLSIETVTNWFKNRRQRESRRTSISSEDSSRVSQSSSVGGFPSDGANQGIMIEEPMCPYLKLDQLIEQQVWNHWGSD